MRTIICLIAVLAPTFVAFGQDGNDGGGGGPDACVQCICKADNTCSDVHACNGVNTTTCACTSFSPACGTGTYALRARTDCSSSITCKYCFSCVYVYEGTTQLATCHQGCNINECTADCNVNLTEGHTYTLWVCLQSCAEADCDACTNCVARGWLFKNSFALDCNPAPACNP